MKNYFDTIIIGGGISGLTFAEKLESIGINTLLIEKEDRLGGCINTFVSKQNDSFWLENASHTIYNSYSNLINHLEYKNLTNKIIKRKKLPFKIISNGKIKNIYSQLNLFRMLFGTLKIKWSNPSNKIVSEHFSQTFGKNNYKKTLKYCFNAVLCQDSSSFPAEFLFKKRKKDKSIYRSFTLDGGLSAIFENTNLKHRTNTTVLKIKKLKSEWEVTTNNGIFKSKNLCLATSWNVSKKLLTDINHKIADIKNCPKNSKITSLSIICNKEKCRHIKKFAAIIGKEENFYSITSRDILDNPLFRGFTIYFKEHIENKNDLLKQIYSILKIDDSAIVDYSHKTYTLPSYNLNHNDFISCLDSLLDKNLYITGNYFTRLAIEDCVKRSNLEFKRYIDNHNKI